MEKKNNKKRMFIILGLLILLFSIGYAYLSANLTITGTSNISNVDWDVHFENVVPNNSSTATVNTAPAAAAADKVKALTYEVTFTQPGQFYEFTVDVKNGGSIDAMIESVESQIKIDDGSYETLTSSNLPAYLDYSINYHNGVDFAQNHQLLHNTAETIKVRIDFKSNISNAQLEAATGKAISFKLLLNYKQADENKTQVGN